MTRTPINAIPPRRWPWLVFAVVAVLGVGLWLGASLGGDDDPAGTTAPPSQTPAASSPTPAPPRPSGAQGAAQPASACLGGPDPYAAVIQAQAEAPLTGDGAAAFLATALRWSTQSPRPAGEYAETGASILDPEIPEKYRAEKPFTGRAVSSTVVGHSYQVMSLSRTEARVAMTDTVLDSTGQPILQTGGVYVATVIDGRWHLAAPDLEASKATGDSPESLRAFRDQVARDGVSFQGECA